MNDHEQKMYYLARYYLLDESKQNIRPRKRVMIDINSYHSKQIKLSGQERGDAAFEELKKWLNYVLDEQKRKKAQ